VVWVVRGGVKSRSGKQWGSRGGGAVDDDGFFARECEISSRG
jgi:hypothetical protein